MSKRWLLTGALTVVAGAVLALAPGTADAQRFFRRGGVGSYINPGGYYNGYGTNGPYYNWPYNNAYYGNQPTVNQPMVNQPMVNQPYQAYYPRIQPYADGAPGNRAHIDVRVPSPNAQVWIEGQATRQQGPERIFTSPPLEPGYRYTYHVRAHWQQNGRDMNQTRTIQVQAGQTAAVDFTQRNQPATQPTNQPGANVPNGQVVNPAPAAPATPARPPVRITPPPITPPVNPPAIPPG